ncbi:hypothetical protein Tco_1408436 [Tanacetum coccineum]
MMSRYVSQCASLSRETCLEVAIEVVGAWDNWTIVPEEDKEISLTRSRRNTLGMQQLTQSIDMQTPMMGYVNVHAVLEGRTLQVTLMLPTLLSSSHSHMERGSLRYGIAVRDRGSIFLKICVIGNDNGNEDGNDSVRGPRRSRSLPNRDWERAIQIENRQGFGDPCDYASSQLFLSYVVRQ